MATLSALTYYRKLAQLAKATDDIPTAEFNIATGLRVHAQIVDDVATAFLGTLTEDLRLTSNEQEGTDLDDVGAPERLTAYAKALAARFVKLAWGSDAWPGDMTADAVGYYLYMSLAGHGVGFWEDTPEMGGHGDELNAIAYRAAGMREDTDLGAFLGDDGMAYLLGVGDLAAEGA